VKRVFNRKDLVACCFLAFVSLFLFKDILISGHSLFGTDFVSCYLGMKQFLYDEVRGHHSIPLWNPYLFGGMPFWAHFESTIFYPLDVLFLLMRPERAYGYTMLLHVSLTSISMYVLGRSLGFCGFGSLIAAIVYGLNGLMMATLYDGQMFRTQSYLWIPLIVWVLNRSIGSRSFAWYGAVAGILWGFQVLSGAPQDAFYTLLAAILFLLFHSRFTLPNAHWNLRLMVTAGLLFLVGAGIAAVQVLPSFEFIEQSVRSSVSYEHATRGSYPIHGLITSILPHFFGNYILGNFWVSDVPWSVPLYNLHVGLLPLMLLIFLPPSTFPNRKPFTYAITLAILALVMGLGSHTPFYKLIYYIPGFDRIRAPAKIIILWVFAWALVAGSLTTHLLSFRRESLFSRTKWLIFVLPLFVLLDLALFSKASLALKIFSPFIPDSAISTKMADAQLVIAGQFHRFTLFFIASTILLYLYGRNFLTSKVAGTVLFGILLLDLVSANYGAVRYNDQVYAWTAETKANLDASIGQDKSLYRTGSFQYGMGANIEMYLGYQTVNGYNPLFLSRYYQYINYYRFYKKPVPEGWIVFFYDVFENGVLMDLLNVKYEISHRTRSYALRESCLPRAFIVSESKIMDREEILDTMVGKDFDPTITVLLEDDSPRGYLPPISLGKERSHAKILDYRPDKITIETDSAYPGYLFLSEVFYPGWKAFVDDRPKSVLRGNYLFRVIEVSEGTHSVVLVFEPLSVKLGLGVTLFTVLALIGASMSHLLTRKDRTA
jgi:hypothetical protein